MRVKRLLSVVALAGALAVAGYIGLNWFQNVQFARAEQTVDKARSKLDALPDLSTAFREVGIVMDPSVVNISARAKVKLTSNELPFDNPMFREFFGNQFPGFSPFFNNNGQPRSYDRIGTGSGVIVEANNGEAYIVTNNHVVKGATALEITLRDGRTIHNAKVLGTDPKSDLAVIEAKIDHVIPAKWGDSDKLRQGDRVMAFGSPFGYIGSMTHGMVSALHRQAGILGQYGYEDFIQTDAPINPGNSGGPLVDMHGNIVGINTAIASDSGGFQGIGFAIPANEAKQIYAVLKTKGHVARGWLGVQIADVSKLSSEARSTGFKGENGVLVKGVLSHSPAEGMLQPGDVITSLNGKTVANAQQLREAVALMAPGTAARLEIYRNGKEQNAEIKLGEQPGEQSTSLPGESAEHGKALGMKLVDPTSAMLQKYSLSAKAGALVTAVEPGSIAAQAGVRPGDLITRVNNQDVSNAQQASDALAKVDIKKGVRLFVNNSQGTEFLFLQAEK